MRTLQCCGGAPRGCLSCKKGDFFLWFQGISSVFHVVSDDFEISYLSDFSRFLGSFLCFLAFSRPVFPFFVLPEKRPIKMDFCLGEKVFSRREKNLCRKKKLFSFLHIALSASCEGQPSPRDGWKLTHAPPNAPQQKGFFSRIVAFMVRNPAKERRKIMIIFHSSMRCISVCCMGRVIFFKNKRT